MGITGQDGSYLAELLLEKGSEVHGIKRRSSFFNTERIDHLYQDPHKDDRKLFLRYGDQADSASLVHMIQSVRPDEIYNLAAQSHVAVLGYTGDLVFDAVQPDGTPRKLLDSSRRLNLGSKPRISLLQTMRLAWDDYRTRAQQAQGTC
jgi:GDPmannose 4,6-dehydratase